jgi:diguanylate cyclase (GGDEF)-like protein
MEQNKELLKIISNETLNEIDSMSIVTPSVYTKLFNEKAQSHNYNIDDEIKISQEILDIECKNLIEMRESNSKNAIKLSASTSKAIDAIRQKDEISLNEALQEAEALKKEIEALKQLVYKDELTGAYNRKWIRDHYLHEDNDRFNSGGTIVIVDMDAFKDINDSYGHAIGDKVLIFISNNLKKSKGDVVRYGGDEFLIFFKDDIEIKEVVSRLHKIHSYVIHKKLKAKNGEFKVDFSLGISQFTTKNSFSEILEKADKKMYENKEQIKHLSTDDTAEQM